MSDENRQDMTCETGQDLVVDELSFLYEAPAEALADWYDEETTTRQATENDAGADDNQGATLQDVSFSVSAGELILVTGESGCGKTTLLRIINGIIPEFSDGRIDGDVLFRGESIIGLPVDRRGSLIGSVFQNPRSQFFNVLVKDELRFGCENLDMPVEVIDQRVSVLVKEFQLESYLNRNLFHLSGGEKQRVACLSVAAMKPPVMLYDEPSSNLDTAGMRSLAQLMRAFKQSGVTQLVAEHRLAYVSDLVDKVILMKDGKIKECFSGERLRSLSREQLSMMGLRSSRSLVEPSVDHQLIIRPPFRRAKRGQKEGAGADELTESTGGVNGSETRTERYKACSTVEPEDLYIESLEMSYPKSSRLLLQIRDYCFKANRIHALVADNGMGKSTFLRSLAGLEKRARGHISYKNKRYRLRRMNRLCSVVFQDVNHQLLTDSVRNELLLSLEESGSAAEEKDERIVSLAKRLELESFLEAHPFSLSGGQKQRLAFATALLMERPVFILDEPTSGLDLKHMIAMGEILAEYAENHIVILATHDQELLQLLNAEVHKLVDPLGQKSGYVS